MYQTYKSLAKYYDLIFQGKDYVKETSFINSVVRERNKNAKSILDVGCGTGTHLNLLVNDFKILYGVDLNREMIQQARKKSKRVKYVVGGMKDFHIKRKFDVLTCLFAVFNYNLNEQEAKKTLKNFRKHLNTNGVLVLALYIKRNLERKVSIHCGKKKDIEVAKINQYFYDPSTKMDNSQFLLLVKDKGKINLFVEPDHKVRIYHVEEFVPMLKDTGFTNINAYDKFTKTPMTESTEYPVVVATAK